jgi:F0F1-type ATP synthase delta subunit
VLDDLTHLREVLRASPEFREVLKNSSVRRSKQREIFASFAPQNYSEITQRFIDTVIEAGRYTSQHAVSPISKRPSTPTSNTAKFSTRKKTSA